MSTATKNNTQEFGWNNDLRARADRRAKLIETLRERLRRATLRGDDAAAFEARTMLADMGAQA